MYAGIGIDFGTTHTCAFAPIETFYDSKLPDHQFDVLCAITPDGRSTETKVIEKSGYVLIGKSAIGKMAVSNFKNSITKPESQKATELFIKRLLEMIERLDGGPGNVSSNAKFVFCFYYLFHSISLLISFKIIISVCFIIHE